MPPWIRRMTRRDIERAVELAVSCTPEEIVALAVERHRKDERIALWVLASCVIGLAASLYLLIGMAAVIKTHPIAWCIGFFASLSLPLPMAVHGRAGLREWRIIALAYLLKKDPQFPSNRK